LREREKAIEREKENERETGRNKKRGGVRDIVEKVR
jgi:hypothetical protein